MEFFPCSNMEKGKTAEKNKKNVSTNLGRSTWENTLPLVLKLCPLFLGKGMNLGHYIMTDFKKNNNNSILPNIVIILICPGEEIPRFQLCNKKEGE